MTALAAAKLQLTQPANVVKRAVRETFLHRHWLCAGNLFDHPNEAAKRAHRGLSRRAQVEAMDTPCLWFRGLLPAEYTTGWLPPPASKETAMVFGAGRASTPGYLIRNHPLYWYTDGSGGKYGQDARLIRAGWGAVGVSCKVLFSQSSGLGSFFWTAPWRVTGPLIVRKFGPFFNCWSVLWTIWLLARTAIIWSSASISDGGLARAASRMVTCGVEIGTAVAGRKVIVFKVRAHVPLLKWLLTPGLVLWAMSLLTLLLRKGLLHEVPIDVVRAVSEADFLAVRIQKQLYTTAIQDVPELKGSAKAPGSREARRITLPQLMAATDHDLLRNPLKLRGQWHCSRCGHTIAHKQLREWLLNVHCVPTVAHGASGPFLRLSTRIDWPAGYAWISQICLQAE